VGYTAGIEGGLLYNPYKQPALENTQIYSFGGALGLYYFPLSRLFTRVEGGIGVYQGIIAEGKGKPGLWWRAAGEEGRFYPMGESWAIYPPVTAPGAGERLSDMPEEGEIARRFGEAAGKLRR
jgi:hypothetical protein